MKIKNSLIYKYINEINNSSAYNPNQKKSFIDIFELLDVSKFSQVEKNTKAEQYFNLISPLVNTGFQFDSSPYYFDTIKKMNSIMIPVCPKESSDKKIWPLLNINEKKNQDNNLLLIGENYYWLNILTITHKENIDVIYIDPPYNTGNTNMGYQDKYGKDAWLNLMNERLKIAHKLLKPTGIIFISIDDNMQAYLKVLMDEIFGESNFICNFIWKNSYTTTNDKQGISINTEYIVSYKKSKFIPKKHNLSKDYIEKAYSNPDNDPNGKWMSVQMFKKKNPVLYEIISPTGKKWTKPWNFSRETMDELNKKGRIYWGKNNNSIPRKKVYLSESTGVNPTNLLNEKKVGYTSDGSSEIESILGNKTLFPYPKPSNLIKYLINLHTNKNAIILDFFAGSGTTGHAVMRLNKKDHGNRQFILCTNNTKGDYNKNINNYKWKNGLAREVTYERLSKIIKNNYPNESLKVLGLKKQDIHFGDNKKTNQIIENILLKNWNNDFRCLNSNFRNLKDIDEILHALLNLSKHVNEIE